MTSIIDIRGHKSRRRPWRRGQGGGGVVVHLRTREDITHADMAWAEEFLEMLQDTIDAAKAAGDDVYERLYNCTDLDVLLPKLDILVKAGHGLDPDSAFAAELDTNLKWANMMVMRAMAMKLRGELP